MSKTFQEDKQDAEEAVQYVEAELASLEEELADGEGISQKRRDFVTLRVARLKKDLKKLQEKVQAVVEHEEWLVRMRGTGQSPQ